MSKLTIEDVVEHEDGSATLTIDMDNEMLQSLLQYAVINILTQAVEEDKTRRQVHERNMP
jgi:hypothetical protein